MSTSAGIIEQNAAEQVLARTLTQEASTEWIASSPAPTDVMRNVAMRLAALRSFLILSNHPFSDSERERIFTRDFTNEVRLVRDQLLLCAALIAEHNSHAATLNDHERDVSVATGQSPELRFEADAPVGKPETILEPLEDLRALCAALLDAGAVGFKSWVSLSNILRRELERINADGALNDAQRRELRARIPPRLATLTGQLSPDLLAADVSSIFLSLFQMLELLQRVHALLVADEPLKQALPIFTQLREESLALLDLIKNRTLKIEGLDLAIHEQLDGLAYALRMELRKAFEYELVGLLSLRHPQHLYAKVENAHGLLRDCFQQSVISLALSFDSQFEAATLFSSFQTKLEQSLMLREELWSVLDIARRASNLQDERALRSLTQRLASFREGGLRFLMYKDWESLERFTEELASARSSADSQPILHRFHAFLETLFSQVSMRAILADHPFHPTAAEA